MTTLTYEQLNNDSRFTLATKPWYGSFPFRISFQGHDWRQNTLFSQGFHETFWQNRKVLKFLQENEKDYRFRNDTTFNVYLKDLNTVQCLIEEFDDTVTAISGPLSKTHNDMMISDLTQSFRKKLYYNVYRYKVSTKLYRYHDNMDEFIDMSEFVVDSFDENNYMLNSTLKHYSKWKELEQKYTGSITNNYNNYRHIPYSATGTVYLKEYDDVCAMHLMFKHIITSTSKVVLIEEIE